MYIFVYLLGCYPKTISQLCLSHFSISENVSQQASTDFVQHVQVDTLSYEILCKVALRVNEKELDIIIQVVELIKKTKDKEENHCLELKRVIDSFYHDIRP